MTNITGRRVRHTLALAATAVLVPSLLVGCSGSESGSDAGSSMVQEPGIAEAPRAGEAEADGAADGAAQVQSAPVADIALTQEKVVSTGTVSLSSRYPDRAVREVQQIVDEHSGQIGNERTETSPQGEIEWARLVVRVPTAEFDETIGDLKQVGRLESSTRKSAVVTDQYVDLESRVRAQQRSLKRVEVLYSRASSIKDIMAIESEVATRQAALDSLTGQLRVLEDQTSLSTITVHISERTRAEPVQRDQAGFLAGLSNGWSGLVGVLVGLATVAGTVLPFALVLLPLALVVWLIGRRLLARRTRKVEVGA